MAIFWRLAKLVAPETKNMLLAALLGTLTIGSGIGLMAVSAYLISLSGLHPSVAGLGVTVVAVRFFGIARGVFRYLERYASHKVTFKLLADLRVWFYRSIEPLAPAGLLRYKSGDLLGRIVADIEILQNFYLWVIAPPAVAVLAGLGMWLLLGAFSPLFALTFSAFYLLTGAGLPWLSYLLGHHTARQIIQTRAELNVLVVDGTQGMADLLAFGQEDLFIEKFNCLNRKLVRLQQRLANLGGWQSGLTLLLVTLALWVMLLVAVPFVQGGQMDGVYLALVALATLAGFEAVIPLPAAFQALGGNLEAAGRLFELADMQPVVVSEVEISPKPVKFTLKVQNLSFAYNLGDAPVLQNVSFELPEGQTLLITGRSGAGKTTLLNLLLRFYDYNEGRMELGGYELHDYAPEDLRNLIGVVSQQTHLFNASVRENLLLARPNATQQEIEKAAKLAQIHDFILSLPKGYETVIGEQGLLLSGGERQRLAIARALLKDTRLLILDEATSNLDPENEHKTLTAIQNLMQGRTTIVVAHHLSSAIKADRVLAL